MKQKKLRVDVERFHEEEVGIERGGKRSIGLERLGPTPYGALSGLVVVFSRSVNGRKDRVWKGITTSSSWTVHSTSKVPGLE